MWANIILCLVVVLVSIAVFVPPFVRRRKQAARRRLEEHENLIARSMRSRGLTQPAADPFMERLEKANAADAAVGTKLVRSPFIAKPSNHLPAAKLPLHNPQPRDIYSRPNIATKTPPAASYKPPSGSNDGSADIVTGMLVGAGLASLMSSGESRASEPEPYRGGGGSFDGGGASDSWDSSSSSSDSSSSSSSDSSGGGSSSID